MSPFKGVVYVSIREYYEVSLPAWCPCQATLVAPSIEMKHRGEKKRKEKKRKEKKRKEKKRKGKEKKGKKRKEKKRKEKKRKEKTRQDKTTPVGVNLMKSQVFYQAAQAPSISYLPCVPHL